MCGRTACTLKPDVLCKACSYKKNPSSDDYVPVEWVSDSSNGREYQPSANFCPTFFGPVMISKKLADPAASPRERIIKTMMWGMIPPWHVGTPTKHGLSTNNCRIEGITEKKLFREPLIKGNRCVVLCDGFYEWKAPSESKGRKQPYFIYSPPATEGLSIAEPDTWEDRLETLWSEKEGWKGPKPLMLAGLFDSWKSSEDGSIIQSYSVVTMNSSSAFAWIHERMPAVLETEEDVDRWLDSASIPAQEALSGLKASKSLASHPVSADVGSVKNQDRSLTRPIDLKQPKALSNSGKFMANWLSKTASPVRNNDKKNDTSTSSNPINAPAEGQGVKRKLLSSDDSTVKEPPSKVEKANSD